MSTAVRVLHIDSFPIELLSAICACVFSAGLPAPYHTLDPLLIESYNTDAKAEAPTALPSSYPAGHWSEHTARRTLHSLCLTNHKWYEAAKPWLWRNVQVRLPQSWLSLVDAIGGGEEFSMTEEEVVDLSLKAVSKSVGQLSLGFFENGMGVVGVDGKDGLKESVLAALTGPDGSIPPELLTPPVSREPSPRRLRTKSKSPARWKIMRSISVAVQDVMGRRDPGIYVPNLDESCPGRHVRHLDFNHFRTIGMRRSVGEGIHSRFVTGERLECVLKESPNLTAFGATEYMDGALTFSVLCELFLRGSPSRGRGRPARFRGPVDDEWRLEEEERERRRECRDLEAIDLTGCVSSVFSEALMEFVKVHVLKVENSSEEDFRQRNARTSSPSERGEFPGVTRLGLRGVKSIPNEILNPFVLAFPSLTHLDLSATRITPDLLQALGTSRSIRLRSLGLARCVKLTGAAIEDFLVNSPVTHDLVELTLYGDLTFPSPLSEDQLRNIVTYAPSFRSGNLRYLDLSSCPLTPTLLDLFAPQLALRSLGICYIPTLNLQAITEFVKNKAKNVEVLSMIYTSPELGQYATNREVTIGLHTRLINPLCTAPFRFSLSTSSSSPSVPEPPTRVRVIELAAATLNKLGVGAGSWRIVRSKGGRAWYVDAASGWVAESTGSGMTTMTTEAETNAGSGSGSRCGGSDEAVLRRDLPVGHPLRKEIERLADANGNVSSAVGWHARKMEILYGHGMLGREDGLYGAVSFAYQG